jgi:hypothetical protein
MDILIRIKNHFIANLLLVSQGSLAANGKAKSGDEAVSPQIHSRAPN